MKNVIYIVGFLMVSCLTFSSCQDDRNEPVITGSKTAVRVVFETPDFVQLGTRTTSESAIKDVTVLQFKEGTLVKKIELSDKLFAQPVELSDLESIPATVFEEKDGTKTIVKDGIDVIVFLANVKGLTESATLTEKSSTYEQLLNYTASLTDAKALSELEYMPMVGYYYNGIADGVTSQINVSLKRALAKINFTLNTDNFKEGGKKVVTTVRGISLHNVPKEITFFKENRPALPANNKPGEWPLTQSPYPAATSPGGAADETGGWNAMNFATLDVTHNQTTGDKAKTFVAYMPENARGSYQNITSNAGKIPANVDKDNRVGLTYLLVDLEYEAGDNLVKRVTYQIYLGGDAAGDMNLLANTQYNVTTYLYGANDSDTRITAGAEFDATATPESTYTILKPANSYIINANNVNNLVLPLSQARNGWRYIDNTMRNKGQADKATYTDAFDVLIQSGDYEIVTLWKTANSGENVTGVVATTSEITANDSGNEKYYAVLSNNSTISAGNNYVIALREKGGDKKVWWTWHLWFTDYNPDASAGSRKGQIHKYFSEAFTTSGLYNGKYMMDRNLGATITNVDDNTEQSQPTSMANAVKWYGLLYQWGRKDPFTNSDDGTTTMSKATLIYKTDNNQHTYIKPNNANTSVGTDWEDNDIYLDDNGNSVDGFPKVSNVSSPKYRVIDAIRNPMHYYHSGANNDWTEQDDKLWNMTTKTVFDPCPPGWRVPAGGTTAAYNPWAGFGDGLYNSTANVTYAGVWGNNEVGPFPWKAQLSGQNGTAGRLYGASNADPSQVSNSKWPDSSTPWYGGDNSVAWYPASGRREQTSGAFASSGIAGLCWGVEATGVNACYLSFNSTVVHPTSVNSRSYGFSVRCVQD